MARFRFNRRFLSFLLMVALPGLDAMPARAWSTAACFVPGAVWPSPDSEIPVNPLIVIEACSEEDFGAMKPALRSETETVPLRFVEAFARYHFAFEPELPLQPATEYVLELGMAPVDPDVELEPASWTTLDEVDLSPPTWSGRPRVWEATSSVTDGIRGRVTFTVPVGEESGDVAVLLEPSGEPSGEQMSARPTFEKVDGAPGARKVDTWRGWNAAFPWDEPGLYAARMTLLDSSGNRSAPRAFRFRIPPPPPRPALQVVTTLAGDYTVRWKVEPEFTEIARKARIFGVVSGHLLVDDGGSVRAVQIDEGLPLGLSEFTTEALFQWRFEPSEVPERRIDFSTHFLRAPAVYDPGWNVD